MCMSYLGAVGQIMHGSGLREALELLYAPNTVPNILNGKAFSRATRAHMLIDTALYHLLVSKLEENNDGDANDLQDGDIQTCIQDDSILSAYDRLLDGEDMQQTLCRNDKVTRMCEKLGEVIKDLSQNGRTAKLWSQYLEMVEILKTFIKAERTGNWNLHLATVARMLPFFAAARHNLYAKSSYVYLTDMQKLPKEHPDVFVKFTEGHHVMRRTDRHWAGLSSDHVIEQVLMRSVKSCGGLTRGRGMAEAQRAQWILSMPACAEMNSAMNDITETGYVTSEQHKEAGTSRMERDDKDIRSIVAFLRERDPFQRGFLQNPHLRNIETGVTADNNVNADSAKTVGQGIIDSMVNQNIMKYSFKRSKQIIPMNMRNHIKDGEDHIQIDPQLLFQRLATAANGMSEDLAAVLSHELSSMPPSLFDSNGLMREAQKSSLGEHIWNLGDCEANLRPSGDVKHVIDGGCLLHRVPWVKGETYGQICRRYTDYVHRRYPSSVVVFDSYNQHPSTKDITHLRRSRGIHATEVFFDIDTPFKTKKDTLLTNDSNKQRFINLLAQALEQAGCEVLHAEGDADLTIVKKAVSLSSQGEVSVVGSDTDLLVLLCHHFDPVHHNIYFGDDSKQGSGLKLWDISKTTSVLGQDLTYLLPAIHSLTGCDTTSRMFGIGKSASIKKLKASHHYIDNLKLFADISSDKNVVINARYEIISCLYGGLPNEGLDLLRYRKFGTKLAAGLIAIQCQSLPPTSDAASFHIQRAYQQTFYWMTGTTLPPTDWGWQVTSGKLCPVKTSKSAAPPSLLKIVRCQCKSNRCSCRKNGLDCTISCTECQGNCSNSMEPDFSDD